MVHLLGNIFILLLELLFQLQLQLHNLMADLLTFRDVIYKTKVN